MSYESDMRRLEEITALLKNPETGLETAIDLYTEGASLSKRISEKLNTLQRKIDMVTSGEGEPVTTVALDDDGNRKQEASPVSSIPVREMPQSSSSKFQTSAAHQSALDDYGMEDDSENDSDMGSGGFWDNNGGMLPF